jgi:hypothetical protein
MVTIYVHKNIGSTCLLEFANESEAKNIGELISIHGHNVNCVQLEKPCGYCAEGKVNCGNCGGQGCDRCENSGSVDCLECEGQGTKTIEL